MDNQTCRTIIEVSGTRFTAKTDQLRRYPMTRLGKLFADKAMPSTEDLTFDRPVGAFKAILAYYQTGELHIPVNLCPKAFKKELEFWQIDPSSLESCCLYKYMSSLSDYESLCRFQSFASDSEASLPSKVWRNGCYTLRNRLWMILANKDKTTPTRIYLGISVLMVALSLLTLILGTMPRFQTPITACDMRDLAKELGIEDPEIYYLLEQFDCNSDPVDELEKTIVKRQNAVHPTDPSISPGDEGDEGDGSMDVTTLNPDNDGVTTGQNPINNETATGGSKKKHVTTEVSDEDQSERPTNEKIKEKIERLSDLLDKEEMPYLLDILPKLKQLYLKKPKPIFYTLEDIINAFFTLELILRLITCPCFKTYVSSVINIVDIVILIAAYINYIVTETTVKAAYDERGIVKILLYFQMLRVLRILRLSQNIAAVRVLGYSIRSSLKDMAVLLLYLVIGVLIFSSFLYFAENSPKIQSIPDACWWSVITMTTVGYGDIVPTSGFGRVIGSLCAISGVMLLSMVIPIFVNTFLSIYQFAKFQDQLKMPVADRDKQSKLDLKIRKDKFSTIYPVATIEKSKDGYIGPEFKPL